MMMMMMMMITFHNLPDMNFIFVFKQLDVTSMVF